MKLYKREGRRFVACELVDNTGKYYQLDGTFSNCKTEESVGLCILSTVSEDIVIYLKDGEFKLGVIPTAAIMLKALLEFRQELNLSSYTFYVCTNPAGDSTLIASAGDNGYVDYYTASYVYRFDTHIRQIIKVRKC